MALKSRKTLKMAEDELKKLILLTKTIDFCGLWYYIYLYLTTGDIKW